MKAKREREEERSQVKPIAEKNCVCVCQNMAKSISGNRVTFGHNFDLQQLP